jgi:hypothetical protein
MLATKTRPSDRIDTASTTPVTAVRISSKPFLRQVVVIPGNLAEAAGHRSTLIDIHDHDDLCCCLLRCDLAHERRVIGLCGMTQGQYTAGRAGIQTIEPKRETSITPPCRLIERVRVSKTNLWTLDLAFVTCQRTIHHE